MKTKEMSMEIRLLIAFVLMGLVLFLTPYFYKQPAPQPATKVSEAAQTKNYQTNPTAASVASTPAKSAEPAPATVIPGQVQADKEETIVVDTGAYRITLSNRGATVHSWILKKYKDRESKPLELVNQRALTRVPAPFSIVLKGQTQAQGLNDGLYQVERSPDNLNLTFTYSDGRIAAKKTFRFDPNSYESQITSEVTQNGVRVPHLLAWRGGFGDSTVANPVGDQQALAYDLTDSKLIKHQVKEAKDGPVTVSGAFSFAGLEDHYFAGVFLPKDRQSVELTVYADTIPNAQNKDEQRIGAAVGGDGYGVFSFFAGPKDTDILRKVDPKLEQLIDWGRFFGFIAKPLFLALNWTNDHLTHNYGWAIVLLTIVINTVLLPLRLSSLKSSKKMQALQPQVNAINEKYKNLSLKDPRKAEQNQELMDLYKKHGVNPVGGCLPTLLQIPFAIAFYTALGVAIELRSASWLWISDLSQPETLAIRVLPVLLVVAQFISQKMTPTPGMDPAQKKMMLFMPLMFGYMFYFVASGVALYWLTSQMVGMAQQWVINRGAPPPAPPAPVPAAKKKK
jgi:YidC/Oxa1 family membrane protein insertase